MTKVRTKALHPLLEKICLSGTSSLNKCFHYCIVADKGYDSEALGPHCEHIDFQPVIAQPQMHYTSQPGLPRLFDRPRYWQCNVIERLLSRFKEKCWLCTRFGKLAAASSTKVCIGRSVIDGADPVALIIQTSQGRMDTNSKARAIAVLDSLRKKPRMTSAHRNESAGTLRYSWPQQLPSLFLIKVISSRATYFSYQLLVLAHSISTSIGHRYTNLTFNHQARNLK